MLEVESSLLAFKSSLMSFTKLRRGILRRRGQFSKIIPLKGSTSINAFKMLPERIVCSPNFKEEINQACSKTFKICLDMTGLDVLPVDNFSMADEEGTQIFSGFESSRQSQRLD